MKVPTFEDFTKNPTSAIAFIALIAIGYLYVDQKALHAAQLAAEKESCTRIELQLQERISSLEQTIIRYEAKLEEMEDKLLECLNKQN